MIPGALHGHHSSDQSHPLVRHRARPSSDLVTEPPATSPVLKFEAIAEACRPMAAILLDRASDREPSASELGRHAYNSPAPGMLQVASGGLCASLSRGKPPVPVWNKRSTSSCGLPARMNLQWATADVHEPDAYRDVLHLLRRPLSRHVVEFPTLALNMPTAQNG